MVPTSDPSQILPPGSPSGRIRLSELFHSIQGEGSLTGKPSVFVRTTGCNLRCWFCDTPYTSWSPEGEFASLHELRWRILAYNCRHVVVTGGEPLLQPAVVPLVQDLRDAGLHVTIETAATLFRPVPASLFSISPKLANSTPPKQRSLKWRTRHELTRTNLGVVRDMLSTAETQFKFVIDHPSDVEEVHNYLEGLPEVRNDQVWLMPQAVDQQAYAEKKAWLEPLAQKHSFQFSPRLHIEQWGNIRGK